MDLELKDKVAAVTGGTRGIGRSIALRLAAEGCHVAVCGRSLDSLHQTEAELTSYGSRVAAIQTDISVPGAAVGFVEQVKSAFGGVDLLVANAGGSFGAGLVDTALDDWKRTFDTNLFHAVDTARAVVPSMQQRGGGSILIISSISGWKPVERRAQYAAAKAAEIQFARSLARELAPLRIRVNALSPGSTWVEQGGWARFRAREPEAFAKFVREELPWGRLATPEEIADVAVFLLSERARWINGANVPVDGGQGSPSAW